MLNYCSTVIDTVAGKSTGEIFFLIQSDILYIEILFFEIWWWSFLHFKAGSGQEKGICIGQVQKEWQQTSESEKTETANTPMHFYSWGKVTVSQETFGYLKKGIVQRI